MEIADGKAQKLTLNFPTQSDLAHAITRAYFWLMLILLIVFGLLGAPQRSQTPAKRTSDRDAALEEQQRADEIRDLYDQVRELENGRKAAEAAAQQADVAATSSARLPGAPDPQTSMQNAASYRATAADNAQRIRELTQQIAFLEGNGPIDAADRAPNIPAAGNRQAGTWILNVAKSEFTGPAPQRDTETIEVLDGGLKSRDSRTNSDGTTLLTEWTARYDRKDYPVKGRPNRPTISLLKIDESTTEFTLKEAGQTTATGRIVCAKDGRSRTVTTTTIDSQGKKLSKTTVWDRRR